jgi:hypothetical protein
MFIRNKYLSICLWTVVVLSTFVGLQIHQSSINVK